MKSDAQIAAAFAALSPEEKERVLGYKAIPLGSALALNAEQQKINANLAALQKSLSDMQSSVMLLLGKHEARLEDHDERISCLEHETGEVSNRIVDIEADVRALKKQVGIPA